MPALGRRSCARRAPQNCECGAECAEYQLDYSRRYLIVPRLGLLPLARSAASKKCDFCSPLATCGGGHIHVPGFRSATRAPATRAEASSERRDFHSKLATCGGGHIHVPGFRSATRAPATRAECCEQKV